MAGLALSLVALPPTFRWLKWRHERQSLQQWATRLRREANHCETMSIQMPDGRWFSVYTAEVEVLDDYSQATYSGKPVRDHGFFVVPPGRWVDSLDDVFRLWDDYD